MSPNVLQAIDIMWMGMIGIFVVIGILALVVYLLAKFGKKLITGQEVCPGNKWPRTANTRGEKGAWDSVPGALFS